ncbi:hypothetical protein WJX84_006948 [Apatococcus fuscideae]|uniref:Proton extrusion protein PcxA n=1 Tax=Apatococcus fuscideae TaxID=2026836 RepID=A0AAW1TLS5_9CHLO
MCTSGLLSQELCQRKRNFASGLLGTGRPVPKNLQDDPFAAEKYWQDWESGLNGKVHHDRPPSDWDGWDAPGAGDGTPPTDYIRSRRALGRNEPRDEYIRPIIDSRGIRQRLSPQEDATEDYLRDEFELNQWESRQSLKFSAILIVVPLIIGYVISRSLAEPTFVLMERFNPEFFELSDRQKVEGAHEVHVHELRLRMGASIGRAPPLDDEEMWSELHHEAVEIQEQMITRNKGAILNLVSDSTSALSLFGILVQDTEDRLMLFRTMGRIFSGLSDTAKAFIIIAVTDILLGYHSEEGWTAAIRMLTGHYGYETEESSIFIFVAIVPVTMDALFKYWIFKGLNRRNPAAAVTLRQMDRH